MTARAPSDLLTDVRQMILSARQTFARGANATLVALYWRVGQRIRTNILQAKRAEYGQEIVATLSRQLGWSHFIDLLPLKKHLQRDFYAEMCRIEKWSVRTLRRKITGLLYERTALVFRDPYFLDFLELKGAYSEKDLEAAILRDLERFLVELGSDFAFLARQKRIVVDGEDFYLDLLFYHRRLHRLVVIDLKLGRFAPGDAGQMEFYLRWLKKHEMRPGEEEPIGLILCAEKSDERVELFELAGRGIQVSEYLTELPPKKFLERKLHEAVRLAQARMANSTSPGNPRAKARKSK